MTRLYITIESLALLTRPLNNAITFIAVWVAAMLVEDFKYLDPLRISLGAFAASLIAAGGNAHNDVCDIDIDIVNSPNRPLPRGIVEPTSVVFLAIVLGLAGIVIGFYLGIVPGIITVIAALFLFLYNQYLKMTVLWGNITISLLTALVFIFGSILAGNPYGGIIPAVFSLLFHFSREMVKDVLDMRGDKSRAGTTFALEYGAAAGLKVAAYSLIALIILVPLPYFAHYYKITYFAFSFIAVEIPLFWSVVKLFSGDMRNLRSISNTLKFGMVMGLGALLMG